ncbi:MAG: hypothetical protein ABSG13_06050 [Bryobacteraceae bacterium]
MTKDSHHKSLRKGTMKVACGLLVAAAGLSFGQSTKKAVPPAPKADTWQKSKECASLAEKAFAEFDRRVTAGGSHGFRDWQNHYSAKYNKCFIAANYDVYIWEGGGKDSPLSFTELIDAFERSVLAISAPVGLGPADWLCNIDQEPADCVQAASFIKEHMKN